MSYKSPLSMASSMTVLLLDWMLFAAVIAKPEESTIATLTFALATAVLSYTFERRNPTAVATPAGRAVCSALAVAIPLPMYGTLLAASFGAWRAAERLS
jgi:hypothetical protein